LAECFTTQLHENANNCRGSPEALWQARLDEVTAPNAMVVSLAQRDGDRFSFAVNLAEPINWPTDTDALIGQAVIIGGEVETDVVFGHEMENAILWGFPYRPDAPRSTATPVDYLIGDFWRICADANAQTFASACEGRRILIDVIQQKRVDDRLEGEIPVTVAPRPKVNLSLNGRYIWAPHIIKKRGARLRVVGSVAGLSANTTGGLTLTLDPASILTPVR
ncbi:MAG: hypothetical protein AAF360_00005, partial [Pseudomonadota bacterium]